MRWEGGSALIADRCARKFTFKKTVKARDTLEHQPTVWPVLFLPNGYAILMRPNKAETAVHGCHRAGDMAVRMRKVLARPWVGVRVCLLLLLFFFTE